MDDRSMSDETRDGERTPEERGRNAPGAEAWLLGFAVGAGILVLLVFAYMIGFNRGQDEADGGAEQATERPQGEPEAAPAPGGPGEALFVENCGSCHTLAAAGTSGMVGPDLDGLAPDATQVEVAIENGGAGSGQMPPRILEDQDAEAVADYVGAAAGR
jgi:mono/diheme cytochrome c family protein